MDRMACVDIKVLPLQLLLRRHPDWRGAPAVVVDRDKPNGVILWVNRRAEANRIVPGMRYAAGLSLARDLRGGVVSDQEVATAVEDLTRRLWCFSPGIEPSEREPGVFWLNASGLRFLYPCLATWAEAIVSDLRTEAFQANVAVGFSHFGAYATARSLRENRVFADAAAEQAFVEEVAIARLGFDPKVRDTLHRLGINTLGGFMALPAAGIRKRFGAEAARWHALAQGTGWTPLNPETLLEPVEHNLALDYPETQADRLTLYCEGLLDRVLTDLVARHEDLQELRIRLTLDNGEVCTEEVAPASPTRDARQILALVALRLEKLTLACGATDIHLHGVGAKVSERQLDLFAETPRRNPETALKTFALLRAELGNDAVTHAVLQEGHLPEAGYRWETLDRLPAPKPKPSPTPPLVRRIYHPVIPLPGRQAPVLRGPFFAREPEDAVVEMLGPYVVSGGWWVRETARAYHYVHTRNGRWLWVFQDLKRGRWFLQGEVQ